MRLFNYRKFLEGAIHELPLLFVMIALGCGGFAVRRSESVNSGRSGQFSPADLAVDEDSGILYVAGYTAQRIAVIDMSGNTVTRAIDLPFGPSGLALSRHGTQLYITGGSAQGRVCIYSTYLDSIVADIPVGHTPASPVLSPNGRLLFVCNRFDNDISVVDVAAQREEYHIPSESETQEVAVTTDTSIGRNDMGDAAPVTLSYGAPSSTVVSDAGEQSAPIPDMREPVSAAITPDGKYLFVASLLPPSGSVAAGVSVIDTEEKKAVSFIALPNGSTGLRGICVSPDGSYVYVTHILARYHVPTTKLDRGWMNTNALSIIDAVERKLSATVLLDDIDRGAANPWGVACSADGARLYVTHAGTHELSIIDRADLHKRLKNNAAADGSRNTPPQLTDVTSEISGQFMNYPYTGLRIRIPLQGLGPRVVVPTGTAAIVADYYSNEVEIVNGDPTGGETRIAASLGNGESRTIAERGELLFHDARFCFQEWQSCASCHPDGRTDGLTWDLLNDGIGNFKSTKSLLLSHRTPPVMATGVRADAETAVRAGQ